MLYHGAHRFTSLGEGGTFSVGGASACRAVSFLTAPSRAGGRSAAGVHALLTDDRRLDDILREASSSHHGQRYATPSPVASLVTSFRPARQFDCEARRWGLRRVGILHCSYHFADGSRPIRSAAREGFDPSSAHAALAPWNAATGSSVGSGYPRPDSSARWPSSEQGLSRIGTGRQQVECAPC